jgi:Thioredoxin domain
VRLAQSFALENQTVQADCIEANEFPDLSSRFRVCAVPKTVINGSASIEGSLPEGFFLDEVLKALPASPPETAPEPDK